ncbi:MAG: LytTR family DNA-binding domain-containing protein [Puia sp.]|nr:LytTR family DNA-binding domain-containing protein [Puia sp.]
MKIVIIEDEKLTARDLADTIVKLHPETEILAMLNTVKESIKFFRSDTTADLIFSDIQLGDGLGFEIFRETRTNIPVIFCTAYDVYALNAFKANGIDYILKPFTSDLVSAALDRYLSLKEKLNSSVLSYEPIVKLFLDRKQSEAGAILVRQKDKIIPVALDNIAFFYLKAGVAQLRTFNNTAYLLSKNLDDLEKTAGDSFFRVNRQYLVNRKAVLNASSYLSRKLSVTLSIPTEEVITVAKEKTPQFLQWLEGA